MWLGQDILCLHTTKKARQIKLQSADCQRHLRAICRANMYLVEILSIASEEPISTRSINLDMLSLRLAELSRSVNFIEAELEEGLKALREEEGVLIVDDQYDADVSEDEPGIPSTRTSMVAVESAEMV